MLYQQYWWLAPSLFSHRFLLLRFPFQKPLTNLPLLGGPKGWLLIPPFPKLLNTTFQSYFFSCFTFCPFFLSRQIPFYQAKRSLATFLHGPSPWVPQGTGHFFMKCWFLSPLPFFCIIGWLMGHICYRSLCSWACSLELSQPQLGLLLHIMRIPGFWESPSILVQLFSEFPNDFLS